MFIKPSSQKEQVYTPHMASPLLSQRVHGGNSHAGIGPSLLPTTYHQELQESVEISSLGSCFSTALKYINLSFCNAICGLLDQYQALLQIFEVICNESTLLLC